MNLKDNQRRFLRRLGHQLKPVVWVGDKGLSEAVLKEIDGALGHHELIKVRVQAGDRAARSDLIASLCRQSGASLVQRVGHVALIYRPASDKPGIVLPA